MTSSALSSSKSKKAEPQLTAACLECHTGKVKCENENGTRYPCKRCVQLSLPCRRKARKEYRRRRRTGWSRKPRRKSSASASAHGKSSKVHKRAPPSNRASKRAKGGAGSVPTQPPTHREPPLQDALSWTHISGVGAFPLPDVSMITSATLSALGPHSLAPEDPPWPHVRTTTIKGPNQSTLAELWSSTHGILPELGKRVPSGAHGSSTHVHKGPRSVQHHEDAVDTVFHCYLELLDPLGLAVSACLSEFRRLARALFLSMSRVLCVCVCYLYVLHPCWPSGVG